MVIKKSRSKTVSIKTWDKSDCLPKLDSKEYKQFLDDLEKNVKLIESYKSKLKPDFKIEDFNKIIKVNEQITMLLSRIGDYGYLWFSEDTSNQEAKSYRSKVEKLSVDVNNRIMFFSLWFKQLDDKNANRLISGVDKEYHYLFEKIREMKKYTLSEAEEKILNIKDVTGSQALIKIYDTITNAFNYELEVDGKKMFLTRGEITKYVKDERADVRRDAYLAVQKVYAQHDDVLNEIYRNLILDWRNEGVEVRGYKEPISIRNLGNGVSDEAIDALINVCRKNKKVFQDYFKLKSKLCNIKKLRRWDLYAPYGKKEKEYTYEESLKIVFEAYQDYSPKILELAKKIVESDHVDYEIRKNKMTGAYCMDIGPGIVPYVLLNHTGELRSVFTIAHEFGHGVHDLLSGQHSPLTCHPPLVLAETASVFGEMLLFEKLMKEVKDNEMKKSLLVNKLDDTYATIGRQIYFIIFEKQAHEMIKNGAGLHELQNAYLDNLKEQFGDSMDIDEGFKNEWIGIPHIYHSPFYCYSYAFGNLLVLALYEKYKEEGESFIPKYLKILEYGGSEKPSKILKEVGIDVEDEKFWQKGFDLVNEMVQDLKKLV
ncbi:M3 family oligoendopeptidase [Candidatus Woesearchaeota archaeon]|nr:M3 family oligoendopeptidase [Candidatus Woesearchaeota archaeon]